MSTIRRYDGLEGTGFLTVPTMGYVVVLKELICTVSTLGECSNLERTDS